MSETSPPRATGDRSPEAGAAGGGGVPPPGELSARRADGRRSWAVLAYAVATLAIVLDQLSKWWVLGPLHLGLRGQVPVVPPLFNLTLVHNAGVSFGLLRASADLGRWLLTIFSLGVAVAMVAWVRTVARPLMALAIGLVIGGAVGNAVDRIRHGFVTDFLDFSGARFPWVFNVADSCITVGVVLLVLESLLPPAAKKP